jgi:molybdopterin synthase catalytic subunit
MTEIKIRKKKNIFVAGPIDPAFVGESIAKHSTKLDIGAHEIFLGQVRADVTSTSVTSSGVENKSKTVTAIHYTAYEEMALDAMHEIREGTFDKFPITCMHVYHSLGEVKAGEICFFVFASSAHRKVAREAVAHVVDTIKEKLPIFGKEIFGDGAHQWKSNQ